MSARRRPWIALILSLALWPCFATSSPAAEARPFNAGSLAAIQAEQAGRRFVLVFWSATCLPCVKELPSWGRRMNKYPAVPILLVNLDPVANQAAAIEMASRKAGRLIRQWVFADEVPERVYWAVDRTWHGEAPFTLLFGANQRVEKHYGPISNAEISRWYAAR